MIPAESVPPWIIQNNEITPTQRALLSSVKIMIGTPMYGGMAMGQYTVSVAQLSALIQKAGGTLEIQSMFNESLVQRGRNAIAYNFTKSNFDYLFCIDADIGFSPVQALEMILLAVMKQMVTLGASYSKKQINWQGIRKAIDKGVPDAHLMHCAGSHVVIFDEKHMTGAYYEPLPVKYLGTGFMLIHKSAFKLFEEKNPDHWYKNNHIPGVPMGEKVFAYFDCDIDDGKIYRSEDYYFCGKLKDAGVTPHIAPWIYLQHFGTFVYEGCISCSNGNFVHTFEAPKK